jgi:hypothetical protein
MTQPERIINPTTPPATPRWVKWFAMGIIVLIVLFGVLHLTGNDFDGMSNHMSHFGQGVQQP